MERNRVKVEGDWKRVKEEKEIMRILIDKKRREHFKTSRIHKELKLDSYRVGTYRIASGRAVRDRVQSVRTDQ